MRLPMLLLILLATSFGSSFWYTYIQTDCRVPIRYHIGNIDERFGTSPEEVARIASNAEAIWEKKLNTELFIYDETGKGLPINFIFDNRQEEADKETELKTDLKTKEGMTDGVSAQYEKLIVQFRSLKKEYELRVVAYEDALKKYNTEVSVWNEKGGAPKKALDDLRTKEEKLTQEQTELETLGKKLNSIVSDLNRIGARGNELITDYNSIVEKYNEEFSEAREFAQGDYTTDAINIYQFDSEEELTIVLAHEFGHALSLEHVEGEPSLMYYRMGMQNIENGITDEDRIEYERVCAHKSLFERIVQMVMNFSTNFAL